MRIAVTAGEPAGIGPDIILQLAQQQRQVDLVVFADQFLLEQRAKQLGLAIQCVDEREAAYARSPGILAVRSIPLVEPCIAGKLNPRNASYVMETLKQATQACITHQMQALVTGPIHKGIINQAGIPCQGHTEFLADTTNTKDVVMMLATKELKVALVTTHLPLREVAASITPLRLKNTITILHNSLRNQFAIEDPSIVICGLNPHAGENGYLGREEIDIINPVIKQLQQQGMNLLGALSADTVFTDRILKKADAVLAMYHDQGLPVLKFSGFGEAVNITLGLPIIRTSVDHGTALDLAGTGLASSSSLSAAIEMAQRMTK